MPTDTMTVRPRSIQCSAVLLDLDGTLVDSSDAVLRGWHSWARSVGAPVEKIASIVHGRSAAETISALLPGLTPEMMRRHVRHVLSIQEVDPTPAMPMAGAEALVRALGPADWGVVTGCSAVMAAARLAAGGLPVPKVLVTDEDVSAGKPHPEGYLLALRQLRIRAADAVAIEDAPAGIAAAKAAGIRTIAVTTTHDAEALAEADLVATGLDQLRITTSGGCLSLAVQAGSVE